MKTKPTLALPVATVLVLLSASAMAQVTFYTSKAAFDAAASTTLLEDFEAFSPKNANLGTFTLHGLTYTSLNSYHLWVDGPGYTTWGAGCPIPNATSILVANGDEDFTAAFSTPPSALGFDTYLNGLGPATVKVFNGTTILGTFTYPGTANDKEYLGIVSTVPITSIRWTSTLGRQLDTGIDNISVAVVPEPSAIGLALVVIGLLGSILRCRRPGYKQI